MSNNNKNIKNLFKIKKLEPAKHYSKKISWLVIILTIILLTLLTFVGTAILNRGFSDADALAELVHENYILSVLIIITICALQVMVALIPGEIVEVASGYAFGAFWGTVYCLTGILVGSITVIILTRTLGRRFIEGICPREKLDKISFINNPKKLHLTVALLFFIPGTPKDLITYGIGLTGMNIPSYILISSLARLPSIIISTLSGGALGDSNFKKAIIFFSISVATGILGYLLYSTLSAKSIKTDQK